LIISSVSSGGNGCFPVSIIPAAPVRVELVQNSRFCRQIKPCREKQRVSSSLPGSKFSDNDISSLSVLEEAVSGNGVSPWIFVVTGFGSEFMVGFDGTKASN